MSKEAPVLRIISCGDELLCGQTVDTNASWLAGEAAALGWRLAGVRTIGDVDDDIAQAVEDATAHADAVVFTGGLGPTADDRSRFAVAKALGVGLTERPELVAAIAERFRAFGRPMGAVNRVQALIPDGATPLANPAGTAPGFRVRFHDAELFVLPGVPREMKVMFDLHIRGVLAAHPARKATRLRRLHLHGVGESSVGTALADLMRRDRDNPVVGTAVGESVVTVRIFARGDDPAEADRLAAADEAAIRERLGTHVFGVDGATLPETVVASLRAAGKTVSTVESCTGGWLSGALVEVPGSSKVFPEGAITYANEAKTARVGVSEALLARYGAVSEEVACAMARGMRERAGTDYALSVTGVAGPDGGTEDKPVGLAWIGLADADGVRALAIRSLADRSGNRRRAVNAALDWLRRKLAGLPPPWAE